MTPLPLSATERAEMKQRAEKATPGPWEEARGFVRSKGREAGGETLYGAGFTVTTSCAWVAECRDGEAFYNPEGNAKFIAAANPQTILRYEATLEAAEARVKELETQSALLADVIHRAFHYVDEGMGDTDPSDPDHPLIKAAQLLASFSCENPGAILAAVQAERERVAKLEEAVECAWVSHPNMSGYGCNFCDAPRVDSPNAEVKHTHDCAVYSIRSPGKATP